MEELQTDRIEQLIDGIYTGEISVFDLPVWLYSHTVKNLDNSFFLGFGTINKSEVLELEKAKYFRTNIGRFSGAKTFQEIKKLTDNVFLENGKKMPFAQFKKIALNINANYNINYLRTEQDSVFSQSQNARKWLKFEAEKELFPTLQYVTIGDSNVRPSHRSLNGLILSVDDPKWNSIAPQNEFGCRCMLIQREGHRTSTQNQIETKTADVFKDFKKNATFKYNPGKTEYIFKENGVGKASYFKVPREFKTELKNNFGFPTVEYVTKKKV